MSASLRKEFISFNSLEVVVSGATPPKKPSRDLSATVDMEVSRKEAFHAKMRESAKAYWTPQIQKQLLDSSDSRATVGRLRHPSKNTIIKIYRHTWDPISDGEMEGRLSSHGAHCLVESLKEDVETLLEESRVPNSRILLSALLLQCNAGICPYRKSHQQCRTEYTD